MKQANNSTNNIDKLPLEIVGMLNLLFKGKIKGKAKGLDHKTAKRFKSKRLKKKYSKKTQQEYSFEDAYMVEIKLDDPIKHIEDGDEFFMIHVSPDEYQSHAVHLFDKDWAVVHKSMFKNIAEADEKRFETLLKKYFETGKIAERKEKENIAQPRRRR